MTKQVSPHQLELLMDFLGQHRTLALGRVRGKEGNVLSNRLWLQCSKILNSDSEGAQKSPDKWKKYYNQYKSRVKAKVRTIKQSLKGAGEGSAESAVLTPLEERLCSVVGGCSSPFNSTDDPLDGLGGNTNSGDGHDDDDQSKEAHFSGIRQTESGENIRRSPLYRRQESFSPTPERHSRSPSPKERKRLEMLEQRLISMEQTRIKVDRELASAINRQATAIEAFVGHMTRFVDIYERNMMHQAPESPSEGPSEVIQKIKEEPLH